MNAEQQRFLVAAYGTGWQTARLLLTDDAIAGAKAGCQSGNMKGRPWHEHFTTTPRGLCLVDYSTEQRPQRLVIPWSAFGQHRKTIPAAALDRLREADRAAAEHHRAWPTFRTPRDILDRRVGPSQDLHPDDREAYRAAHDAHYRDVLTPYLARGRELAEDLTAAVLACLPLALDDEPADLLELLATTEA